MHIRMRIIKYFVHFFCTDLQGISRTSHKLLNLQHMGVSKPQAMVLPRPLSRFIRDCQGMTHCMTTV